ncbi:hypothetical protein PENNAL_c0288G11671 [Penicillium nalgiovense]|uniref:Uncharacterized protein n=1 Tax=Penicillium nalgiovense TaxID=60175 RepID=A0A1V6WEJ6_PENNA|nr:hypothetical protein PENNAL_c0288G11671 [Penicillium nalgiovense]
MSIGMSNELAHEPENFETAHAHFLASLASLEMPPESLHFRKWLRTFTGWTEMPFGSSSLPYCAYRISGIFIINILVIVAFALIVVVPVSTVIAIGPRMGSTPLEFGLQALFAGLEEVS